MALGARGRGRAGKGKGGSAIGAAASKVRADKGGPSFKPVSSASAPGARKGMAKKPVTPGPGARAGKRAGGVSKATLATTQPPVRGIPNSQGAKGSVNPAGIVRGSGGRRVGTATVGGSKAINAKPPTGIQPTHLGIAGSASSAGSGSYQPKPVSSSGSRVSGPTPVRRKVSG